jgi:hypothetical protein
VFASYRGLDQPKVAKTVDLIPEEPANGTTVDEATRDYEVRLLLHHLNRSGVGFVNELHAVRGGWDTRDDFLRY